MGVVIDYTSGFFEAAPTGETVGSISGNATLDLTSGNVFSHTPTANTTFAFSNPPASGTGYDFTMKVTGANVASGYDIANASYDNVSFNSSAQEASLYAGAFNTDGTKLFTLGYSSDTVHEYSLTTAYDISTLSYSSNSFSVSSQSALSFGLAFNNDGTKFYICDGATGGNIVYQYSMSTAFDITTASYSNLSKNVSSAGATPRDIHFKPDGTKLYVLGNNSRVIYQYSLSTAYDISTASYDNVSFSVSGQTSNVSGLTFSPDGSTVLISDAGTAKIYKYTLSTPWLISSASSVSNFSVASQNTSPSGLLFNSLGTKMYVLKNDTAVNIFQYTTGSVATATFTYPASVEWPSGTAPTAPANGETDVYTFFTTDGGTNYYGFQAGDALA